MVGVAATVDLDTGEAEASEREAEAFGGRLVIEEVVTTPGLEDANLMDDGAVLILDDDELSDKAAVTIGGGVTVGVVNEGGTATSLRDEITGGGAAVGVVNEDVTITLPEGGTTTGMDNNDDIFIATTGMEKVEALFT